MNKLSKANMQKQALPAIGQIGLILLLLAATGSLPATGQPLPWWYEQAAASHPALKAAEAGRGASAEEATLAGRLPDPELQTGVFAAPIETRVGPQQARLGLRQMLPWPGTVAVRKKLAALSYQQAEAEEALARQQVYLQVSRLFAQLYETTRKQALEQENVALLERMEALALRQYENAGLSLAQVIRLRVQLAEANNRLRLLETTYSALAVQLNLLAGREEGAEITVPDTLTPKPMRQQRDLILNKELRAKQLAAAGQEERTRLVEKENLPKVGLGLDYVLVGRREDMEMPDNGKDAIMPMVSLSLPLAGRAKEAEKRQQALRADAATWEREALALELQQERARIAAAYEAAALNLQLYSRQAAETRKAADLAATYFSTGTGSLEDLLEWQQEAIGYQKGQAEALARLFIAFKEYEFITGTLGEGL